MRRKSSGVAALTTGPAGAGMGDGPHGIANRNRDCGVGRHTAVQQLERVVRKLAPGDELTVSFRESVDLRRFYVDAAEDNDRVDYAGVAA